jgi:TetR/AcrR family transcriptional regulator, repressor for neighboring sulfatase
MAAARPRGREEVVEALLQSARRLIAERGPGVSLREIAEDAGVNFGLLYHYFGAKAQLVDVVYAAAATASAERLSDAEHLEDAVQRLMVSGDGTTARLLGWAVLEGRGGDPVFRDSPALELLATLARKDAAAAGTRLDDEAQVFAAFTMALALGWRLFGETALLAAGLDDAEPARWTPTILEYVHQLADTVVGTEHGGSSDAD